MICVSSSDLGRWHAERAAELLAANPSSVAEAQVHATLALFWKGECGSFPPFDPITFGDGSAQEQGPA